MRIFAKIQFTLLLVSFTALAAADVPLPTSDGFTADRESGDVCTVDIDDQSAEIELFAQKPIPVEGVQTDTADWFHHMPRVGSARIGDYPVQVSIFSSKNMKQESVHVLTVSLLNEQGEKYASVGANVLATQSEISLTKVPRKGNGETVNAACRVGSSHISE